MPSVPQKRDAGGPIPAEWELSCLECGYDLTGLIGRVCPECGQSFSPRATWEANQAGERPRSEGGHSKVIHLLILAGIVAVLLAGGRLTDHFWAAFTAVVVILAGEVWVHTSDIRPLFIRLMIGALCVFILMWVLA